VTDRRTGAAQRALTSARQHLEGRRTLRLVVGLILLGIGLLGLLMPILPGWLLIFVGLALIGVRLPSAERLKDRARRTSGAKPGDDGA
jgi:hypothetical protein